MRLIADTNLLVRLARSDDEVQSARAQELFIGADLVAIPVMVFCEFDWVMRKHYKWPRHDVVVALKRISSASNAVVEREPFDVGLAFLEAGADFADGVIAFGGRRLGGEMFASFDAKAKRVAAAAGFAVI